MAKQEKSRFQLNKGTTDHGFDISKGGKRKFDLTKDIDELVAARVSKPESTTPVDAIPAPQNKKYNWLWIILAIIVIILLIWWLLPGKTSNSQSMVEEETIEEVPTPSEDTESVSYSTEITTGEDTVEANVNNDEKSTPSKPIVNTPVATPATPQSASSVYQSNASSTVSNDVEAEALKVIRGDYGIGQERKNKLGNQYEAIQRRVNELKREGAF